MCGIFGFLANKDLHISRKEFLKLTKDIAILSETRGKEASGFALLNKKQKRIDVFKSAATVSKTLQNDELNYHLNQLVNKNIEKSTVLEPFGIIGHARLVTNGSQLETGNNQPVAKNNIVGIHNGIIVNEAELWKQFSHLERKYEVDSEVLFSLIADFLKESKSIPAAMQKTFQSVYGTVATAFIFKNINKIVLGTNNGSLYTLTDNKQYFFFASERFILNELQKKHAILANCILSQLHPDNIIVIDTESFDISTYSFNEDNFNDNDVELFEPSYRTSINTVAKDRINDSTEKFVQINKTANSKLLEFNIDSIKTLKRCTKCLLPETFPFIEFDNNGVCNVCNNYTKKIVPKGKELLLENIEKYKNQKGEINCIIPYSGGRDSSYSVHYVKKELGLNPITYTYDWGMVTDLARRNIARVCAKLGIENIIVSADIAQKRSNIQKNILAWLKKPHLGMVPLFMAGDKQFHYYLAQVKKQNNIDLSFWGTNYLENTDFKLGFCGIDFDFSKERISSLKQSNKIKLSAFYLQNYLTNPSYINASIFDTLKSFASRYVRPKQDYLFLYDYVKWDEKLMEDTLINEYDWETSPDTKSTWRIGDGTASFYNYIYYTVAGFSEFDTFRSNQIREGLITREEALKLVNEENFPRFDSLVWYFNTVGIEFDKTIKRINSIPKLYQL